MVSGWETIKLVVALALLPTQDMLAQLWCNPKGCKNTLIGVIWLGKSLEPTWLTYSIVWLCFSISLKLVFYPFFYVFLRTPSQGAQTSIYCAVSEEVEGVSGRHFRDCRESARSLPASLDSAAAQRLWTISTNMTGLNTNEWSNNIFEQYHLWKLKFTKLMMLCIRSMRSYTLHD